MSNEYICNKHEKIIKLVEKIERYRERDFETVGELLEEVQSIAWDIRTLAEECKEMGQSMEGRLRGYYDAITGLGFERVGK